MCASCGYAMHACLMYKVQGCEIPSLAIYTNPTPGLLSEVPKPRFWSTLSTRVTAVLVRLQSSTNDLTVPVSQ